MQVQQLDRQEEFCRRALLDKKQQAVHAAAEAQCAAEHAAQRHSARKNELHACVEQQKTALDSLQGLHEQIVQAPANVVNKAVVLYQLQAGGLSAATVQGQIHAGSQQQEALRAAAVRIPTSESSLSSMPLGFGPDPAGAQECMHEDMEARCVWQASQNDGFSSVTCSVDAGRINPSERLGTQDVFDPYHTHLTQHTCCPSEAMSFGPALSFSEDSSESDPEDYEAMPCSLVHQDTVTHSQGRLASQLYMRKLALRVLHAWRALRLAALDTNLAAVALSRMARIARALRQWLHITVHLAEWREERLRTSASVRRRMVLSWVLHAWQSLVMDQHELLHNFLVIRCSHSRRLQLAALAGLWINATRNRTQRSAICAHRQRSARKVLRSWRSSVQVQRQLIERVLEFMALCAQRRLHRCLQWWNQRTRRKRRNRVIIEKCTKLRERKQCSAAFECWSQFLDRKALLQRVFARAEQFWEEALQVCARHQTMSEGDAPYHGLTGEK